jgi:pyruvate formate lyase activating enzyme
VAGELAAVHLDPVEKKPLFHFLPGSLTFSLGSLGCNFSCLFCQNSEISQYSGHWKRRGRGVTPAALVEAAGARGAGSISYTYNEPTIFFELLRPTAELAHAAGLRNIMVSNAYLSREAFAALDGLVDAANFDLKAFSDLFYKERCGARLKPVLQTLKRCVRAGWWVEVTTLLIGGLNDGAEELDALAAFIAEELGPDTPWHVSRFHPAYKMPRHPSTAPASVERALEAGRGRGLRYVYAGNMPGHAAEHTFCPGCGGTLIRRLGFQCDGAAFAGACPACGREIPGVWKQRFSR